MASQEAKRGPCASEMLFVGGDNFTEMFQGLPANTSNRFDKDQVRRDVRDHIFDAMNKLRQEDFLCDVKLLVGPNKVPFRAHRIVLAGFSQYFKGMFSVGTKESSVQDICLPSVDPEPMKVILDYIYTGKADISSGNIQKLVVSASFFGSELLVKECTEMMKLSVTKSNSVKLLEFADHFNLHDLKKYVKSFLLQNLKEIAKSNLDFVKLPIPLLIELVEHPAAVVCEDSPAENEKQLFMLLWNSIAWIGEEHQKRYIPSILKAVHLPCVHVEYLQYIETKVGHVPEALELIQRANELFNNKARDPWASPRGKFTLPMLIKTKLSELERDDIVNSQGVYLQGVLFHVSLNLSDGHVSITLHSSMAESLRHVRAKFWVRKLVVSSVNVDGIEVVNPFRSLIATGHIEPTKTSNVDFTSRSIGTVDSFRSKLGNSEFEIDINITFDVDSWPSIFG